MASPALESMCCLFNDSLEHKGHYIWEGMRQGHGIYSYLCIISASVSSGGAFYQLLPRKPVSAPRTTRELESWQRQNRIICWLAFADLLASIGVLIRAAVWLAGYAPWEGDEDQRQFSDLFCAISTGWIQFFYISTYLWTFCYALDIYRLVHDMEPQMIIYHCTGWFVSLVLCLFGLLAIYTPSIDETTLGRWLPQYLTVNVPILMVMIINPILYYKSSKKVENTLRGKGLYTDSERTIVRNLKKKFLLVILVFYVCWFPNIINCVLLLGKYSTYKVLLFALWNFMALVNPMQAFLNSLVYRGLGGCQVCMKSAEEDLIPRRRRRRPRPNSDIQSNLSTDVEQSSEAAPLLSFRL